MQVTQTSQDGLKHEFTIVVGAGEIEDKIDAKIGELKKQAQLPGFRPGKVPPQLLRQRFGKALIGEVLEDAVRAGTEQALQEKELRPALRPNIEVPEYSEGDDLEYKLSIEALPDIELPDFAAIKLERLVAEVTDAQVDEAIEEFAAAQKSFADAPEGHAAETGDALIIDFVGRVGGEEFEGGNAEGHQLELGTNSFVGTFEDQLIGVKAGEERLVKIIFPEQYANDKLAGRDAEFDVKVEQIKRPLAIAIDDDLAKGLGLETLDALKSAMRERIEREHGSTSRQRLKRSLLDALSENQDFGVPIGMVDVEFDTIWHQLEHDMEHAEETFDSAGRDKQEVRDEYRLLAERRVRLGLLLAEVGHKNNIEVSDDELKRAMMEQAQSMPGRERALFEFYQSNPQMAEQLRAPIFENKIVDFIFELAEITDTTVSLEDLMRDPDEAGDGEAAEAEATTAPTKRKSKKTAAKKSGGRRKNAVAEAEAGDAAAEE